MTIHTTDSKDREIPSTEVTDDTQHHEVKKLNSSESVNGPLPSTASFTTLSTTASYA